MTKESSHRASELKEQGWSVNDVQKYIDLWDYRQRWGAINLEREDRLFLRKAEAALPVIQLTKASVKKPLREKSYYCRIAFFLDIFNLGESKLNLKDGERGLWPIILEEELRALDYFEPVLGLPDTLKSKVLAPFREENVSSAIKKYGKYINLSSFNFHQLLDSKKDSFNKSWQPLRDEEVSEDNTYPVIDASQIISFREDVRKQLFPLIKNNFPSLSDTDKQAPPDDWIPDSIS